MIIDCDSCTMKHIACHDCVVSFLTAPGRRAPDIGADERTALAALAQGGLVPPLRLLPSDVGRRRAGAG